MEADDPGEVTPNDPREITLASREEAFAELVDLNDEPPEDPDSAAVGTAVLAAGAPPVVVVVVTHNPGDWLEETLESLAAQTYDNLSILIIDAASDIDPTPRIARVLPGAYVRRLEHNLGFGPTLNEVTSLVSGASFYCFCHDDVALDPTAIHQMIEEAFRSNAGVVGPKLVDWDDPGIILAVGLTIDKTGSRAPYAERGELDQEQHDAVRDVFMVPGACTLVRADLFAHLGGFDPKIDLFGEDLDLCWRAHLVGARVVVAPRARVRHREAMTERRPDIDQARLASTHRLRTVLSCYSFLGLVVVVPQAIVISVIESILDAWSSRSAEARSQYTAWTSNLRHAGSVFSARRRVAKIRESGDREVRRLQAHSLARLSNLARQHRREREDLDGHPKSVSSGSSLEPHVTRSLVPYAVSLVVVVLLIGSRELFTGPLPSIGQFVKEPSSAGDLWSAWFSGWNPSGLGSTSPMPTITGVFAALGSITLGSFGLLRRVGILALLPIGVLGAWRMAAPLKSKRAQLAALVVYAAIPVPYNAFSQGRWFGLVAYAASPWLLAALGRASKLEPFVDAPSDHGAGNDPHEAAHPERRILGQILGLGLLLGLIAMVMPFIVAVVVVMAIGLTLGALVAGRIAGIARMLLVTMGAVVVAAILQVPWTLGFLGANTRWDGFVGMESAGHGWLSLGKILRFDTGSYGSVLGFAFLVAGLLPLLIGRDWRFTWAARAWGCAIACWGALWVGQQHWSPVSLPDASVLLAPTSAALALAVACGMAAFDVDLPGYRFGWRQAASIGTAAAVLIGALPMLGGAVGGRWNVPTADFSGVLRLAKTPRGRASYRTLWVGDPDVLPAAGWRLDSQLSYATTTGGTPDTQDLWAPSDPAGSSAIADAIDLATSGQTTRLGRLLADMNIRYVLVPIQSVPAPYGSTSHPVPPALTRGLENQLDLSEMSTNSAIVVYENSAWRPGATLAPPGTRTASSVAGSAVHAPSPRTLPTTDLVGGRSGKVDRAGTLGIGQAADPNWRLTVDGRRARRVTLQGWQQGFVIDRPGQVRLSYHTPPLRSALLVLQAILWIVALWGWRRMVGRPTSIMVTDIGPIEASDGDLVKIAEDPAQGTIPVSGVVVTEHETDPSAEAPEVVEP